MDSIQVLWFQNGGCNWSLFFADWSITNIIFTYSADELRNWSSVSLASNWKKILINYQRLKELLEFDSYEHMKPAHKHWVESCLSDGDDFRYSKWTESVAVGNETFIQNVKVLMGGVALGRKVLETGESFQLKEGQNPYIAHFGRKRSI